MRGRRGGPPLLGCACLVIGVIVLLSLILPSGFWWFLLGAAFVAAGIFFLRCR